MKKFNLSEIMKKAHNLYNNCRSKYATFADALRKSWKMAKFNVWVVEQRQVREVEEAAAKVKEQVEREEAQIRSILFTAELEATRIKADAKAKAQRMREEIAARREGIAYNEYQNRVSRAMGYGRGMYCGD